MPGQAVRKTLLFPVRVPVPNHPGQCRGIRSKVRREETAPHDPACRVVSRPPPRQRLHRKLQDTMVRCGPGWKNGRPANGGNSERRM